MDTNVNGSFYRKTLVAALLGFLVLVGPGFGQKPETTNRVDLQIEGKRALKEGYFRMRREKPGDAEFDAAKARREAYDYLKNQEAALGATRMLANWINIGPAPVNNGQTPTFDPRFPSDVTGRVSALAIDDIDDAVYLGGAQGGVWKSTDNGASWTPLTDNLASIAIGSIAIDPAPHAVGQATIYIGTGEGNGSCDSYGGVGVFKSTDSGNTWSGPFGSSQFTNRGVTSLAVDRTDPNHLLATSSSGIFGIGCVLGPTLPSRGIYESLDGGLTWTQRTINNNRASVVIQDPVTATTWWGSLWFTGNGGPHDGGLVRSIDNGLTWTQIGGVGGLPAVNSAWSRAWVTATSDGLGNTVLYLGTGHSGGRIYKSINTGATWSQLPAANQYCNPQCFYDMPIFVEPDNPNVLYTGGAGASTLGVLPTQFMRSDNGGISFMDKVRSADMTTALHADVHAITTWPGDPDRLWTGNDGGVWRSDDKGDNWINVNSNLAITQFSGGDLDPSDPNRAYGGTQDNGTMGWTGGSGWPHLDFGDGGFALIDQGNPQNLVHTYFNASGQLIGCGWTTNGFATTMGFYNFSSAPGNGINIFDRVLFYAPMHLDRGVSNTLYFGTHKLYRANNFWVTAASPGHFSVLAGGQDLAPGGGALSAIETLVNPTPGSNANLIYTGSNNGRVFRSTNGGASFTQVDIGGSSLYVSDVAVDPNNSNIVYQSRAGFAGAAGLNVRKSTDGGNTWAASGSGIPDIPVNALVIDPLVSGRVWAGTDISAYVSTDSGATWTPHNTGMANVAIFDLKANGTTNRVVAFTHGRSAYSLDISPQCMDGTTRGGWNIASGATNGSMWGYIYDSVGNFKYKIRGTLVETSPGKGTWTAIMYDGVSPDPDFDVKGSWKLSSPPIDGVWSARIFLPGTSTVVGTMSGRFRDDPNIAIFGKYAGVWQICP